MRSSDQRLKTAHIVPNVAAFSSAWAWRFAPRCRSLAFDIIPVVFGSLSALKISPFCSESNNRLHRLLIGRHWNRCFLLLGESLGNDDAPASNSILLASSACCVSSSSLWLRISLNNTVYLLIIIFSFERFYCSNTVLL